MTLGKLPNLSELYLENEGNNSTYFKGLLGDFIEITHVKHFEQYLTRVSDEYYPQEPGTGQSTVPPSSHPALIIALGSVV